MSILDRIAIQQLHSRLGKLTICNETSIIMNLTRGYCFAFFNSNSMIINSYIPSTLAIVFDCTVDCWSIKKKDQIFMAEAYTLIMMRHDEKKKRRKMDMCVFMKIKVALFKVNAIMETSLL